MKRLSKEKQQQLILISLATVGMMGLLWYFLISYQNDKIVEMAGRTKTARQEIDKIKKVVRDAAQTEAALAVAGKNLAEIETGMPAGDLFSWTVSSIKQFNRPSYKVEIPSLGVPTTGEMVMIPSFPYNQSVTGVGGNAFFYDLGRFLADFENKNPYSRIQNLAMEPMVGSVNPEDKEKLSFRMEIVTLVKQATP